MVLQDGVNFLAGRFSQQRRLVQAPDARQTPPSEPSALWTGSKWATAAMHAKSQRLVPGITLLLYSLVHPLLVIHDSYVAWRKYSLSCLSESISLTFWVCISLSHGPGVCPTSSLSLSPFILLSFLCPISLELPVVCLSSVYLLLSAVPQH